jgi:hypothetical protein
MPALEDRPFSYTEDRIAECTARAFREVLTDPVVIAALCDGVATELQARATKRAGGFLLGAFRVFVTRWVVIGVLVMLAARYFGITTAAHVWNTLTGKAE